MNDQGNASFSPGLVLGQRYELLRSLRSEAQGEVMLARDQVLDVDVGLKILSNEHLEFDRLVEYYRREALWGLRLHHPQILGVHHLDETGEGVFLIQEPFAGNSLWELLGHTEALTTNDSLYFIEVLAQGMAFAHKQGVSHQNFNPQQVLVSATDGIKIVNFAFPAEPAEIHAFPEIQAYIAPEVWQGRHPTAPSNLFSLGVIGYRMLTGALPFPLQPGGEFPYQITGEPQHFEDIPETLRPLFIRCLKQEPEKRFPNASDFLSRLTALRDKLTPAVALTAVAPVEEWEPAEPLSPPAAKPAVGPMEPEVEIDPGWQDSGRSHRRDFWSAITLWLGEQRTRVAEVLGPEPLRRNRTKQVAAAVGGVLALILVISGLNSLFAPTPKLAQVRSSDKVLTEPAAPSGQAPVVPKPTIMPAAPAAPQEPLPEPASPSPPVAQPKPPVAAAVPPAATPPVKVTKPQPQPAAAKPAKAAPKPAAPAPEPRVAKPETAPKLVATLAQETAARKKADALTRQGQKAIVKKSSKGDKTVYQVWVTAQAAAKPATPAPKPNGAAKPAKPR